MRLTTMSSSIIHQILDDEINVIYEPDNSLFDHILCTCTEEINYHIFSNNVYNLPNNCISLSPSRADLYNYDICAFNDITTLIRSKSHLTLAFHITDLIFQHRHKPAKIKKEDFLIIYQKVKNKSKVFFNQDIMSSWGYENSQLISYGIPLHIFTNSNNNRNANILILNHNNTVSQEISHHFSSQNIQHDILNDFSQLSINDANDKLNEYKIVFDLKNDTINQLCALACGCDVVALSDQSAFPQFINTHSSISSALAHCHTLLNQTDKVSNYEETKNYLDINFNYDKFKRSIAEVMEFNKRKAFIL